MALAILACTSPATAGADWLITPYIGRTFGGETTFLVFEQGAGLQRKTTVGGAVALLSDALLGVEAEVGHTAGFFKRGDRRGLILSSRVTTVTGSVMLAVPVTVTRESLRPYLVGGVGLMQARSTDIVGFFPLDKNLLAVNIGGGAIGVVSERTGFRFDVRHFKAATGDNGPFPRPGVSSLSFWRASVGVTIRY